MSNETNTINNQKSFVVEVINEQSKIALISDIAHPDLGMLKRSIEANKQRKVDILNVSDTYNFKDYQLIIFYQPNSSFRNSFDRLKGEKNNYLIITGTQTDWNFLNTIQTDFLKSTINQTENYQASLNTSYSSFVASDIDFDEFPPLQAKFGDINFNSPFEVLLYQKINGIQVDSPLLATFKSAEKNGAILLGENIWKWRMFSHTQNKSFSDFDGFMGKLVQYLSLKEKLSRLELNYEKIVYQNDLVEIKATYFDNNYVVDTRANLTLSLRNTQTNEVNTLPFRLVGQYYSANVANLESGSYAFTVKVEGQNLQKNGAFTVLDYNIEQQFTHANMKALRSLAVNNNGNLYHTSNYGKLLETLNTSNDYKPIQKSSTKQTQLIDWKYLLGLIVLFLGIEWFVRKYYGKI